MISFKPGSTVFPKTLPIFHPLLAVAAIAKEETREPREGPVPSLTL